MAPIAKIFFSISLSPRFLPSQKELGRDGLQRRPLHAPKLTQIICLGKVTAKVGPVSNQFLELNW